MVSNHSNEGDELHHVLIISFDALPFLVLASASAVLAIMWLFRAKATMRAAILRFALVVMLWALVSTVWLSQPGESLAADWYRWVVPLSLLMEVAAVDAISRSLYWRVPRVINAGYLIALAGLAFAFRWHPTLNRPLVGAGWSVATGWNRVPLIVIVSLGLVGMVSIALLQPDGKTSRAHLKLIFGTALAGLLLLNDVVWDPRHVSLFPTQWVVGLGVLVFLGVRMFSKPTTGLVRLRNAAPLDSQTGFRYGELALAESPTGVLCVGWGALDEVPGIYRVVFEALGQELSVMCRSVDRLVRLDTGEYLIVLPAIPFHDERRVRERIVQSIRDVVMVVGDKKIALAGRVKIGWAWAEPGVSFAQLVHQARQSFYEETAKYPRSTPTLVE